MKILYDFRPWQIFNDRGVGRYIKDLFSQSIKLNSDRAYILLDDIQKKPHFDTEIENKIFFCVEQDFSKEGKFANEEFDCFINGSAHWLSLNADCCIEKIYPEQIIRKCKKTTAILYDFIPLFFHTYIPSEDKKIAYSLETQALKSLDLIFTDSLFTQASAMKYLDMPKEKFICLYGGADTKKFTTKNSFLPYSETKRKNHLIYVAGFAPQKNYRNSSIAFCKAYKQGLLPKDAKLYIVCAATESQKDEIKMIAEQNSCKYKKHIEATGFISDEEMLEILTSARASIFPSYYEGLGLPILESYMAGTPCWASNVSATKEIALSECSFNPFNEEAMINAFCDIYNKPELCIKSLEFGRKLIKDFTWENAAKKMLRALEKS